MQTQTEYELATQRYRQSLFQIKQAYQVCRTAQIKLAILAKAVDDTTIRAPFDGWVAEKLVAVGEQISSGMQATKVVTLVRIDPLRLSLTVPQQDIGRMRPGQTVRFRVDSFPDRVFEARVRFIAPVVANDTRSMVVEAVAPNPDGALRPGVFATAELELPKRQAKHSGAAVGRAMDRRGGQGLRCPRRRRPRASRRPGRHRRQQDRNSLRPDRQGDAGGQSGTAFTTETPCVHETISPLWLGKERTISPLPLGEGPGVRAAFFPINRPHPNPLPKGEGTMERP